MKNRNIFTAMLLVLACFAFLPKAQAACGVPDLGCANFNLAEGDKALFSLTTGEWNTALGASALSKDTDGNFNTAVGAAALLLNTGGDRNTAVGAGALVNNVTGGSNTAVGTAALQNSNSVLGRNTAVGDAALGANTIGAFNTAVGVGALQSNINGIANHAVGYSALLNNTSGGGNTAIGHAAGSNATTGNGNVYIGSGMDGVAGEALHTYIKNINTTTVSGGGTDSVTVNLSTGLLGHVSSARRYKEDINPMNNASEALYGLKPVTFRYKKEIDRSQSLEYGLVAEDVAKVDPNLAIRDGKGQIESVRYTAINAMLLNEFIKEHKKVEEQQANIAALKSTVAQQQKGMEVLTAQLKEQAAQIQKVSAQIEVSKPAPQVVNNP
jgi:Chaperone of endosialidase